MAAFGVAGAAVAPISALAGDLVGVAGSNPAREPGAMPIEDGLAVGAAVGGGDGAAVTWNGWRAWKVWLFIIWERSR